MEIQFVQDMDRTIGVMLNAGQWLLDSGKNPSKWWQPQNLNPDFLLNYASPTEFYVGLVQGEPAVGAILQLSQNAQDWQNIDHDLPQNALYIHWLCVHRKFAGIGLPVKLGDFATELARKKGVGLLRTDTNAEVEKLRRVYENMGFSLQGIEQEDYRLTAFYQKRLPTE